MLTCVRVVQVLVIGRSSLCTHTHTHHNSLWSVTAAATERVLKTELIDWHWCPCGCLCICTCCCGWNRREMQDKNAYQRAFGSKCVHIWANMSERSGPAGLIVRSPFETVLSHYMSEKRPVQFEFCRQWNAGMIITANLNDGELSLLLKIIFHTVGGEPHKQQIHPHEVFLPTLIICHSTQKGERNNNSC